RTGVTECREVRNAHRRLGRARRIRLHPAGGRDARHARVAVVARVHVAVAIECDAVDEAAGRGELLDGAVRSDPVDLTGLPAGVYLAVGPDGGAFRMIEARRHRLE